MTARSQLGSPVPAVRRTSPRPYFSLSASLRRFNARSQGGSPLAVPMLAPTVIATAVATRIAIVDFRPFIVSSSVSPVRHCGHRTRRVSEAAPRKPSGAVRNRYRAVGKPLIASTGGEVQWSSGFSARSRSTTPRATRFGFRPGGRRALLVALLLRRGEVVSMDALIEALWGERAPSTAGKAVQGYVSHLRRLLGGDGAAALVTRSPGYMLHIEEEQVDAARFARLAAEGQGALEDGDPSGALATLDASLALWRGPALAEFAFDDFAQREIQRLTERRLEVTEDRVDALLQLGRHSGLVSELESLVAANPLRERPRGQLMLALYRSGRPADALQVYKEGARLSRELGLDPAAELRRLEKAILEQDPSIAAPAPAERRADTPSAGDVAPGATQPRDPRRFGRRHLAAAAVVAALLVVGGIVALDRATGGATSVAVLPPAVVAVDPETNRVVASIKTGSKPVTVTAEATARCGSGTRATGR